MKESSYNFWRKLRCPKCPEEDGVGRIFPAMIANQVLTSLKFQFYHYIFCFPAFQAGNFEHSDHKHICL